VAINVFGVTADGVQRHMFPQWPSFSTKSNPTAVTVGEIIDEQAAKLAGQLLKRSIDASTTALTQSGHPLGWAWCASTLKLMVAMQIVPAVTGLDPAVVNRWGRELKERLKELEEHGATVLGDVTADEETDSPLEASTHIDQYDLETSDTSLMSGTGVRLRYDDEL